MSRCPCSGTRNPGAGPPVTERCCLLMTCCCWGWSCPSLGLQRRWFLAGKIRVKGHLSKKKKKKKKSISTVWEVKKTENLNQLSCHIQFYRGCSVKLAFCTGLKMHACWSAAISMKKTWKKTQQHLVFDFKIKQTRQAATFDTSGLFKLMPFSPELDRDIPWTRPFTYDESQ